MPEQPQAFGKGYELGRLRHAAPICPRAQRSLPLPQNASDGGLKCRTLKTRRALRIAELDASGRKVWWSIVDYKIGIVPLPVFFILIAVIAGFALTGKVPSDILMAIVLLSMGGFTCAELGKRHSDRPQRRRGSDLRHLHPVLPCLPSLAARFSILVSVQDFTEECNFLYLFIAASSSAASWAWTAQVLIGGFMKIFVPLAPGSLAGGRRHGGRHRAGPGRHHVLFVVVPIMAGGVGEGAIPLSIGYSALRSSRRATCSPRCCRR